MMNEKVENLSSSTPTSNITNKPNSSPALNSKIKFSLRDKYKEIMGAIKEKTGIDGIYVVIFLALCVLLVHLGIFESLITSLVGTLYPGFSTIKAIQKNHEKKKDWLTYWIIYGCFLIFDSFSGIFMRIFHFYFVAKIIFLIWLFLPGSKACSYVYDFIIKKIMIPIESFLDKIFAGAKSAGKIIEQNVINVGNVVKFPKKLKRNLNNNANNDNKNNDINSSGSVNATACDLTFNKNNLIPELKKEEEKLKKLEDHIKFQEELEKIQESRNLESNVEKKEDENNIQFSGLDLNFENEEDNLGKTNKKE